MRENKIDDEHGMGREGSSSNIGEDLIGSATAAADIVEALAKRGCSDLTPSINSDACSDFPCAGGGFCDVYHGVLHNGTRIAIKSLRVYDKPGVEGDDESRKILKRAARELYHWSKLQHRNVLPLMGLAVFRGQISMVSGWMENGTLVSFLRLNPNVDRNRLCMDICEGLCYIHTNGMVHGDLKASNVVVSASGTAMITDFGSAQWGDLTLRFSNTTRGGLSVRWAAPELLLEDSSQVSKETDVYAYGMTVLETLTGKVPYEGISDTRIPILVAVEKKVPSRPGNGVDDDLWDLVNSCWSQEPSKRPEITSIRASLEDLLRQRKILLKFSRWNEGEIFDWYNGLSEPKARSIHSIQIWKSDTGPTSMARRFIVLHMHDNSVHQFNRGPACGSDDGINMVELLGNRDVQIEDSCTLHLPSGAFNKITKTSKCEIEQTLTCPVDILNVIAACYAMSINGSICNDSLLTYNVDCHFFCGAIGVVVARLNVTYEIPQYDSVARLFQSHLDRLALFIVTEVVELLSKLDKDLVWTFRTREPGPLRKGPGVFGVIRDRYQQSSAAQLLLGLRPQLTESVKAQLSEKWQIIYKAIHSMPTLHDRVNACLWSEEIKDLVQSALKTEIENMIWGTVLEAIVSSLGDIGLDQFADTHRKISPGDVWKCAMYGGLLGANEAVQVFGEEIPHRDAFRRAWFAAGNKALAVAMAAAERNIAGSKSKKPNRRDTWDSNWRVWDECWAEVHDIAQPRTVEAVEKIVQELSATGTAIILEGIGMPKHQTVGTPVPVVKTGKVSILYKLITYAGLRNYLQNFIQENSLPTDTIPVQNSRRTWLDMGLGDVWRNARQYLTPQQQHLQL